MLNKLIELCNWLEPLIRPLGWHCAATGSALYGCVDGREPEDLDVLLYRHSGWKNMGVELRPFDVLLRAGFRQIQDCTEYPEFAGEKETNGRKVFRVVRNGIKIDFLCLEIS